MYKEDLTPFRWRLIEVGVPHKFREDTLFWYYGQLVSLNEKFIVLKKKDNQLLMISLDRIKQIKSAIKQKYKDFKDRGIL